VAFYLEPALRVLTLRREENARKNGQLNLVKSKSQLSLFLVCKHFIV